MSAINKENEKVLTQARVREVFSYNKDTGVFTWKTSTTRSVKIGDVAGCINTGDGYRQIAVDGKTYKAHRLVWLYIFGKFPDKYIDHISGISDDNRLCNLRDVTHQENQKNQPPTA